MSVRTVLAVALYQPVTVGLDTPFRHSSRTRAVMMRLDTKNGINVLESMAFASLPIGSLTPYLLAALTLSRSARPRVR